MRYLYIKGCALVLMGVMLAVIAACDDTQSVAVHGSPPVVESAVIPDGTDKVLDGICGLYPLNGPKLPETGVVDNLMIAYHVPGMEHVHGYTLPVQFYFEYLYAGEGMMAELDRIRQSLHSVEYDDENPGRVFLTGTAGLCVVNVTAFLKDGPDSLHYSVEMPEGYLDREAFLKKIRVGPIGEMIYESMGDVEYARHVFDASELWVWGYLTEQDGEETTEWYRERAEEAGYADITIEQPEEGVTHIHTRGAAEGDDWTAQVQGTEQGYTYVTFTMVHADR